MKRALIILLVLLTIPAGVFADKAYFSSSVGLVMPVKSYAMDVTANSITESSGLYDYKPAFTGDVAIGYEFNRYIGLGASMRVNYLPERDAYRVIVPLYFDIKTGFGWGNINFPITISIGGHMETDSHSYSFGPSGALSVGAEISCNENVAIFFKTVGEVHISMDTDLKGFDLDVLVSPVSAGITTRW